MENNRLDFSNGKSVSLKQSVHTLIDFQNNLIVLLKKPLNERDNRNVFAYDSEGNLLWQIEDLFPNDNCHYNLMKLDENSLIHLYNWCGFIVKVNPLSGEIIQRIFTK